MVGLDLLVKLRLNVSDNADARLQQGEGEAFKALEEYLRVAVNDSADRVFRDDKELGRILRIKIEDAGPHNVVWEDE